MEPTLASPPANPPTPKRQLPKLVVIILAATAVIATLSAAAWLGDAHNNKQATPSNQGVEVNEQSTTPVETAEVSITTNGFVPASIVVKSGTTVKFTNTDGQPHRIVSDPHPAHDILAAFDSEEPLNPNDSFSFTFEQVGTFGYHDETKPSVTGSITVE